MLRTHGLLLISLGFLAGCTGSPAKPPGGTAEKPKVEGTLAFTDLLDDEYLSSKIRVQPADVEDVHEHITLTGWIMAKPGNEVTLTAPAAGYVRVGKGKAFPGAGMTVGDDQELFLIEPVFSPSEKIQVDALKRSIEGDKKKAESTLDTAKKDYDRTLKLHGQKAKSDQELELALKAHKHAEEELEAAKDKLKLFDLPSRPIKTPLPGTVLQVHVGAGQYVPAAAPLATIIDLNPVWVRVPVPEFYLEMVDKKAGIEIITKNPNPERSDAKPKQHDKSPFPTAKPTGRVPQIDPVKHTGDLWYQLDGPVAAAQYIKDQMVTVHVKINNKEKASVVPYSAIIFDSHGSTWIYLEQKDKKDGKHLFERRRVELVTSHGAGDGVIIRETLTKGDLVVTNGAAALFSREFHKTPVRATEGK